MWSYQHQNFTLHQLPALNDNYIYLIEDHNSDALIVIDPADDALVSNRCKEIGRPLTHILNTHHHWDHTDGNSPLKRQFDCEVIGAAIDAYRIPEIDVEVDESSDLKIGTLNIKVLSVPGHTLGHIAYLIDDALFCGDTLFGCGCGRLFEGTPKQMWNSLSKLASLPDNTSVYCAHEYTLPNLRFAQRIEPDNSNLKQRISSDTQKRMKKLPTIPSTIKLERATNPFLRPADISFCKSYAARHNLTENALELFTHIRKKKDQ